MGMSPIFALSLASVVVAVVSTVAVWRSSNVYTGPRLIKAGARATTVLGAAWHLFNFGVLVYVFVVVAQGASDSHDEDRIAEKAAIPSASHPMAGFWKTQSSDNFGLAVSPASTGKYSVSFCGPGGCFKPGTYRPDTALAGDVAYQIVDENTLRVQGKDGWTTYHRAPSRGEDCVETK